MDGWYFYKKQNKYKVTFNAKLVNDPRRPMLTLHSDEALQRCGGLPAI